VVWPCKVGKEKEMSDKCEEKGTTIYWNLPEGEVAKRPEGWGANRQHPEQ